MRTSSLRLLQLLAVVPLALASFLQPENNRFVLSVLDKDDQPLPPYDLSTASSFASTDNPLPSCIPSNVSAADINELLATRGSGFVLSLCPSATYTLDRTLVFKSPNQEISTFGYPVDQTRAMLVVDGSTNRTSGMATAIYGAGLSGTKLRNVQLDGNRGDSGGYSTGGLIEMGGTGSGQVVDHVRSFSPRGWSCLHITEGQLDCYSASITNNDIGPCGHAEPYGNWADGISFSCKDSLVEGNTIVDPTDGGIVVFGAQGSIIRNNTISVRNETALGGINLVDFTPTSGDYTGTIVEGNHIYGGFADSLGTNSKGPNSFQAMIKIGIAVGPRVWFGAGSAELLNNRGGTVRENTFEGSFGYALAVANVQNFTVVENTLVGNTSFIGTRGVNCTNGYENAGPITLPTAFVVQTNTTGNVSLQSDFQDGEVILNTCIVPPSANAAEWAYGSSPPTIHDPSPPSLFGDPSSSSSASPTSSGAPHSSPTAASSSCRVVATWTLFFPLLVLLFLSHLPSLA